jgi:hypothetical protein
LYQYVHGGDLVNNPRFCSPPLHLAIADSLSLITTEQP